MRGRSSGRSLVELVDVKAPGSQRSKDDNLLSGDQLMTVAHARSRLTRVAPDGRWDDRERPLVNAGR